MTQIRLSLEIEMGQGEYFGLRKNTSAKEIILSQGLSWSLIIEERKVNWKLAPNLDDSYH